MVEKPIQFKTCKLSQKTISPSKLINSQQIDHNMIYAKTQYANYAQESIFIIYDTTSEKLTP